MIWTATAGIKLIKIKINLIGEKEMKKNFKNKWLPIILALSVLVGLVAGVSVNAAESEEVEIIAQNIVYGDKVSIAYAVKAEVSDALSGNIGVSYYWAGETAEDAKDAFLLDTTVETNLYDGKYPVFVTEGVPAKNLDSVAFAAVKIGDLTSAYDHSYSAVQYLYTRLYRDGFANKTEADGLDYERKKLYNNLLAYGASAQSVLINGKTDAEKVTLVTDYSYAYTITEGVTLSGKSYVIGSDSVSVTAEYTGDRDVVGWILTYNDGNVTEVESSIFEVSGVAVIEPKYGVHICADGDKDHVCDTCFEVISECVNENAGIDHNCDVCGKKSTLCTDANGDAICDVCNLYGYDYTVSTGVSLYTFSNTSNADPEHQTEISETSTSAGYYGVLGSIATDPKDAANKALKLVINKGTNNSNVGLGSDPAKIHLQATEKAAGGKIHVIEYDFYAERFNKAGVRNFFALYAYDADGNNYYLQNGGKDGSTNAHTKAILAVTGTEVVKNAFQVGVGSTQSEGTNYALFDSHTWYRFRFVFDEVKGTISSFVSFDNGENWYVAAKEAATTSLSQGGVGEVDHLAFGFTTYGHGEIFYVDNVSYKVMTEAPEAHTQSGTDAVEALYR